MMLLKRSWVTINIEIFQSSHFFCYSNLTGQKAMWKQISLKKMFLFIKKKLEIFSLNELLNFPEEMWRFSF